MPLRRKTSSVLAEESVLGRAAAGAGSSLGKRTRAGMRCPTPRSSWSRSRICALRADTRCARRAAWGSTNQYGAEVNFNLCIDSGASAVFLGPSGVGLAVGTATSVDCSVWSGSIVP
ncbi:glycoside hydrolase family 45 protein [Athelia psychrophila]|uniref:Glycoside hydrolase family 45 protein n=1 Tax=Athelia psychrophila TaxID=1759441 RepID=A0A166HRN9_9AGAM|nr:glycoside hydrolase family 45 protein [Fibularhizoctonia sp. CBS 109695]